MKIAVFYHKALMGNHIEVHQHILSHLTSSGLSNRADVIVTNEVKDVTRFEFPTLELIKSFATHNPEYYILYIHSKGVSRKEKSMYDWREYMLYFMVDNWQECVTKLSEGFDTIGINYLTTPLPHYQGNFWWGKASYIKKLCNPLETPLIIDDVHRKLGLTDRHKAEMWLLTGKGQHHSLHSYDINPYDQLNPKENYRK